MKIISLILFALGATMIAMDINKQTPFLLAGMTESGLKNRIKVEYTNYRGERGIRTIVPISFYFGTTEYNPQEQWLVKLWDVDRQAERIYALKEIRHWNIE